MLLFILTEIFCRFPASTVEIVVRKFKHTIPPPTKFLNFLQLLSSELIWAPSTQIS
jgi:hypothetical protein